MKKKINRKKVLFVSIILIIIIGIISFFVIKYIKGNDEYIAPNIEINEEESILEYENNLIGITIKEIKAEKKEKKPYIVIEIENTSEQDRYDIPIEIDFVNLDGDVIFNTGYVVNVLFKGTVNKVYALVTPQIAKLIQKKQIDHIKINEVQ